MPIPPGIVGRVTVGMAPCVRMLDGDRRSGGARTQSGLALAPARSARALSRSVACCLASDAVATDGDVAELGVGAGSPDEGAAVLGDAIATDGDVPAPAAEAGPFAVAEDASAADPFSAAAIARAGVGAGSASESADMSAGEVAAPVAVVGALALMSAQAIGIGESEAKAAAPSAIADARSTFWVIETSVCDSAAPGAARAVCRFTNVQDEQRFPPRPGLRTGAHCLQALHWPYAL